MRASIYHYRSASRYLLERVVEKQKEDRHFSIRKWSKEMGYRSHTLLAMVLQGKRSLTLKQVPFLSKGLNLSMPEKTFFEGLVQVENARTPEEKFWCETKLSQCRPHEIDGRTSFEMEEYAAISNWIHPALLALSNTAESFRSAEEAAQKIPSNLSLNEIRIAIDRLSMFQLLVKNENGVYQCTHSRVSTKNDQNIKGVIEYHKESAALLESRITEDASVRECQSMAIAIPSQRLPLAKELIRNFRIQFAQAMSSPQSNEVYQFNLHFFRLTKHPSENKSLKENEGADLTTLNVKEKN